MKFIWIIVMLCLAQPALAGNLEEVEELVNSHHFNRAWEEDVFDCADMASANWQFFKDRGYNPVIAVRKQQPWDNGSSHCYIIIPVRGGLIGLDTSMTLGTNTSESLGTILRDDVKFHNLFMNPTQLMRYDKSISDGLRLPYNYRGVIDDN